MLRTFVAVMVALLLVVGGLVAAEVKGKVKSYKGDELTVTADGKDSKYIITADTKVLTGKDGKPAKDREKALKGLKSGAEVVLQVEKKGDKEVVTELKIAGGKKKKDGK
jgi:hypothetical protein